MDSAAISWLIRSRPLWLSIAVIGPLISGAILGAFRDEVTAATAVLVQVVWVVVVSATGDRTAGILAAVSGAAWFDFFFTSPYHQFTISDPDDVEAAILLVVIGAIVGELALWGYRQQAVAARQSGYLSGVLEAAQVVAEDQTPAPILTSIVAKQISDVVRVPGCRYVSGPINDPRIAVLQRDGEIMRNGHAVDVARQGLPTDEEIAIPVQRADVTYGYYAFNSATKLRYPSVGQLQVAALLADQTAAGLAVRS